MRLCRTVQKVTAGAVCVCFLLTQEMTLPAALARPETAPANVTAFPEIDPFKLRIPESLGKIEDAFAGQNLQTVVLIQDAHAIPDAQKNIQKLIAFFQSEYGIDHVAVEGAPGLLEPQIFKSFPERQKLKAVFKDYLQKGELSGAAAAAIFNVAPARYEGVEDWALYEAGYRAYLNAAANQPAVRQILDQRQKELTEQKKAIYSPALIRVDQILENFMKDKEDLSRVLQVLSENLPPEPESELALVLAESRGQGDDASRTAEVRRIAEKLRESWIPPLSRRRASVNPATKLSAGKRGSESVNRPKEEKQFNQKYQGFQTGQVTAPAFALFLLSYTDDPVQCAALVRLSGTQKRLDAIEGTQFFRDFTEYGRRVKASLMTTTEQRTLDQETENLNLIERLAEMKLDQEDWDKLQIGGINEALSFPRKRESVGFPIKTFGDNMDLKQLLQPALEFYRNAKSRDGAMFKRVMQILSHDAQRVPRFGAWPKLKGADSNGVAVGTGLKPASTVLFVAGGFHTRGITRLLKEKGIAYVVVMPAIQSIPEKTNYAEQMAGHVSWSDYLKVENGAIDLHAAFIRGTRDRLLDRGQSPDAGHQPAPGQSLRSTQRQSLGEAWTVPRDSLLAVGAYGHTPLRLKTWRDQIIRDLAAQGKIERAGEYTRFIDEVVKPENEDPFKRQWIQNIKKFMGGMRDLDASGQLDPAHVMGLLGTTAAFSPPVALARAELRGFTLENGLLKPAPPETAAPIQVKSRSKVRRASRLDVRTLAPNTVRSEVRVGTVAEVHRQKVFERIAGLAQFQSEEQSLSLAEAAQEFEELQQGLFDGGRIVDRKNLERDPGDLFDREYLKQIEAYLSRASHVHFQVPGRPSLEVIVFPMRADGAEGFLSFKYKNVKTGRYEVVGTLLFSADIPEKSASVHPAAAIGYQIFKNYQGGRNEDVQFKAYEPFEAGLRVLLKKFQPEFIFFGGDAQIKHPGADPLQNGRFYLLEGFYPAGSKEWAGNLLEKVLDRMLTRDEIEKILKETQQMWILPLKTLRSEVRSADFHRSSVQRLLVRYAKKPSFFRGAESEEGQSGLKESAKGIINRFRQMVQTTSQKTRFFGAQHFTNLNENVDLAKTAVDNLSEGKILVTTLAPAVPTGNLGFLIFNFTDVAKNDKDSHNIGYAIYSIYSGDNGSPPNVQVGFDIFPEYRRGADGQRRENFNASDVYKLALILLAGEFKPARFTVNAQEQITGTKIGDPVTNAIFYLKQGFYPEGMKAQADELLERLLQGERLPAADVQGLLDSMQSPLWELPVLGQRSEVRTSESSEPEEGIESPKRLFRDIPMSAVIPIAYILEIEKKLRFQLIAPIEKIEVPGWMLRGELSHSGIDGVEQKTAVVLDMLQALAQELGFQIVPRTDDKKFLFGIHFKDAGETLIQALLPEFRKTDHGRENTPASLTIAQRTGRLFAAMHNAGIYMDDSHAEQYVVDTDLQVRRVDLPKVQVYHSDFAANLRRKGFTDESLTQFSVSEETLPDDLILAEIIMLFTGQGIRGLEMNEPLFVAPFLETYLQERQNISAHVGAQLEAILEEARQILAERTRSEQRQVAWTSASADLPKSARSEMRTGGAPAADTLLNLFRSVPPYLSDPAAFKEIAGELDQRALANKDFFDTFNGKGLREQPTLAAKVAYVSSREKAWRDAQKPLTALEETWLFKRYYRWGDFEKAVDVYEQSNNAAFLKSRQIQADYLSALNRLGLAEITEAKPWREGRKPISEAIHKTKRFIKEARREGLLAGVNDTLFQELYLGRAIAYKNLFVLIFSIERELKKSEPERDLVRLAHWLQLYHGYYPGVVAEPSDPNFGAQIQRKKAFALQASRRTFEKSYLQYVLNFYPGINFLRALTYEGKTEEAREQAPLIREVALKADPKYFWTQVALFETALLMEDRNSVLRHLGGALKLAENGSETRSLMLHLQTWRTLNQERGLVSPWLDFALELLDFAVIQRPLGQTLQVRLEAFLQPTQDLEDLKSTMGRLNDKDNSGLGRLTAAVERSVIHLEQYYKGIVLPNNANSGGMIPDYILNRTDNQFTRALLEYDFPGIGPLKDAADRNLVDRTINDFIERIFHLVVEKDGKKIRIYRNLHSPEHQRFNELAEAFLSFIGARTSLMAGTNIVAAAALGFGDCRPTNFLKQRLLGGYDKYRLARRIRQALAQRKQGNKEAYRKILEELDRRERHESVALQVEISSDIGLTQGAQGEIQVDYVDGAEGRRPYRDGLPRRIESHTLAAELVYDSNNQIQKIILKDVWYKWDDDNTSYNFCNYEVPLEEIQLIKHPKSGAETIQIRVRGGLLAYESKEGGKLIPLDVFLTPNSYSGERQRSPHRYADDRAFLGTHLVEPPRLEDFFNGKLDLFYKDFSAALLDWFYAQKTARSEQRQVDRTSASADLPKSARSEVRRPSPLDGRRTPVPRTARSEVRADTRERRDHWFYQVAENHFFWALGQLFKGEVSEDLAAVKKGEAQIAVVYDKGAKELTLALRQGEKILETKIPMLPDDPDAEAFIRDARTIGNLNHYQQFSGSFRRQMVGDLKSLGRLILKNPLQSLLEGLFLNVPRLWGQTYQKQALKVLQRIIQRHNQVTERAAIERMDQSSAFVQLQKVLNQLSAGELVSISRESGMVSIALSKKILPEVVRALKKSSRAEDAELLQNQGVIVLPEKSYKMDGLLQDLRQLFEADGNVIYEGIRALVMGAIVIVLFSILTHKHPAFSAYLPWFSAYALLISGAHEWGRRNAARGQLGRILAGVFTPPQKTEVLVRSEEPLPKKRLRSEVRETGKPPGSDIGTHRQVRAEMRTAESDTPGGTDSEGTPEALSRRDAVVMRIRDPLTGENKIETLDSRGHMLEFASFRESIQTAPGMANFFSGSQMGLLYENIGQPGAAYQAQFKLSGDLTLTIVSLLRTEDANRRAHIFKVKNDQTGVSKTVGYMLYSMVEPDTSTGGRAANIGFDIYIPYRGGVDSELPFDSAEVFEASLKMIRHFNPEITYFRLDAEHQVVDIWSTLSGVGKERTQIGQRDRSAKFYLDEGFFPEEDLLLANRLLEKRIRGQALSSQELELVARQPVWILPLRSEMRTAEVLSFEQARVRHQMIHDQGRQELAALFSHVLKNDLNAMELAIGFLTMAAKENKPLSDEKKSAKIHMMTQRAKKAVAFLEEIANRRLYYVGPQPGFGAMVTRHTTPAINQAIDGWTEADWEGALLTPVEISALDNQVQDLPALVDFLELKFRNFYESVPINVSNDGNVTANLIDLETRYKSLEPFVTGAIKVLRNGNEPLREWIAGKMDSQQRGQIISAANRSEVRVGTHVPAHARNLETGRSEVRVAVQNQAHEQKVRARYAELLEQRASLNKKLLKIEEHLKAENIAELRAAEDELYFVQDAITRLRSRYRDIRVVHMGDIHADRKAVKANFEKARIPGGAYLVQVGDYINRGKEPGQVDNLLRNLQNEMRSAGGDEIRLAGNHELLLLESGAGDESALLSLLRYMSQEDREAFFQKIKVYETKNGLIFYDEIRGVVDQALAGAHKKSGVRFSELVLDVLKKKHVERKSLTFFLTAGRAILRFDPDYVYSRIYGALVRDVRRGNIQVAASLQGLISTHAGIGKQMRRALKSEIAQKLGIQEKNVTPAHAASYANFIFRWAVMTKDFKHAIFDREEGLFWKRNVENDDNAEAWAQVYGHNANSKSPIQVFADGRLFNVDVGMSDFYGNGLGVLDVSKYGVVARRGDRFDSEVIEERDPKQTFEAFESEAQLEDFLKGWLEKLSASGPATAGKRSEVRSVNPPDRNRRVMPVTPAARVPADLERKPPEQKPQPGGSSAAPAQTFGETLDAALEQQPMTGTEPARALDTLALALSPGSESDLFPSNAGQWISQFRQRGAQATEDAVLMRVDVLLYKAFQRAEAALEQGLLPLQPDARYSVALYLPDELLKLNDTDPGLLDQVFSGYVETLKGRAREVFAQGLDHQQMQMFAQAEIQVRSSQDTVAQSNHADIPLALLGVSAQKQKSAAGRYLPVLFDLTGNFSVLKELRNDPARLRLLGKVLALVQLYMIHLSETTDIRGIDDEGAKAQALKEGVLKMLRLVNVPVDEFFIDRPDRQSGVFEISIPSILKNISDEHLIRSEVRKSA